MTHRSRSSAIVAAFMAGLISATASRPGTAGGLGARETRPRRPRRPPAPPPRRAPCPRRRVGVGVGLATWSSAHGRSRPPGHPPAGDVRRAIRPRAAARTTTCPAGQRWLPGGPAAQRKDRAATRMAGAAAASCSMRRPTPRRTTRRCRSGRPSCTLKDAAEQPLTSTEVRSGSLRPRSRTGEVAVSTRAPRRTERARYAGTASCAARARATACRSRAARRSSGPSHSRSAIVRASVWCSTCTARRPTSRRRSSARRASCASRCARIRSSPSTCTAFSTSARWRGCPDGTSLELPEGYKAFNRPGLDGRCRRGRGERQGGDARHDRAGAPRHPVPLPGAARPG